MQLGEKLFDTKQKIIDKFAKAGMLGVDKRGLVKKLLGEKAKEWNDSYSEKHKELYDSIQTCLGDNIKFLHNLNRPISTKDSIDKLVDDVIKIIETGEFDKLEYNSITESVYKHIRHRMAIVYGLGIKGEQANDKIVIVATPMAYKFVLHKGNTTDADIDYANKLLNNAIVNVCIEAVDVMKLLAGTCDDIGELSEQIICNKYIRTVQVMIKNNWVTLFRIKDAETKIDALNNVRNIISGAVNTDELNSISKRLKSIKCFNIDSSISDEYSDE